MSKKNQNREPFVVFSKEFEGFEVGVHFDNYGTMINTAVFIIGTPFIFLEQRPYKYFHLYFLGILIINLLHLIYIKFKNNKKLNLKIGNKNVKIVPRKFIFNVISGSISNMIFWLLNSINIILVTFFEGASYLFFFILTLITMILSKFKITFEDIKKESNYINKNNNHLLH